MSSRGRTRDAKGIARAAELAIDEDDGERLEAAAEKLRTIAIEMQSNETGEER